MTLAMTLDLFEGSEEIILKDFANMWLPATQIF
jgi:hypothetical protein